MTTATVPSRRSGVWSAPEVLDPLVPHQARRLAQLVRDGVAVHDASAEIVACLDELRGLGALDLLEPFDRESAVVWVHLPWARRLVTYPSRDLHRLVRTFRNRNLVTPREQAAAGAGRIAVFGLSVGSNVVDQLAQDGVGAAFLLCDGDTVDPTNLNRLRSTMAAVGLPKVTVAAQKLSEVDPWIEQRHLRGCFTAREVGALEEFGPDVVFDEVDDLGTKALLRLEAARLRVPLLMVSDLGETSVVDVERHDLGAVAPFNGRVSARLFDQILAGDLTERERRVALVRVAGARHLRTRLLASALEVGRSLGGMPQLGSTAASGGALASVAVRAVLAGERLASGTYSSSSRRVLRLGSQASVRETLSAVRGLRGVR
ncbi:ThiF family adenylyltransferase [Nocardioides sp. Y6]|uniref:ThiF family adenylyltransferase n=1 Tax=Nocardioides malaquae TaxID=2773426 RepID=A0ABR9RPW0_9ACTN|nr:ThiF family adenylyltransferase [Nocardioides malaquae]MBE7323609.1 ThiF family adenylyltransferase [Nocardioides malaquae]